MRHACKLATATAAFASILGGPLVQAQAAKIVVYSIPTAQPRSTDYSIEVRSPGGSWHALGAYRVTVGLDPEYDSSMAMLDTSGPVDVSVTKESGTIDSALVRPRSLGIEPVIAADRRSATFTLPGPDNVSFEVNGDREHNLQLFANPIEHGVPRPGAKHVIYYGPGFHRIGGDGVRPITSNTTVYLAPGAIVRGSLRIRNAHDVVIRGRGILTLPNGNGPPSVVLLQHASNVGIRDVTIVGSHVTGVDMFSSKGVTIANLKEMNSDRWSDGIDVEDSSDVLVDGSYLRTADDSIAIFGSRYGFIGDSRNVVVRNTSLWPDVAHAVLIGVLGDPDRNDVIEQVAVQNVDILEHDESLARYQGATAVDAGDNVTVRRVRFDHVRVDDITLGQLVNVEDFLNPDYNKKPGHSVSGIFFRDVTYNGNDPLTSQIVGHDSTHRVSNVVFENLVENGTQTMNAGDGNIGVGPFTSGVVFRNQPTTVVRDDGDKQLHYTGSWSRRKRAGFLGGSGHFSSRAGSSVSFVFAARQARICGLTSPAGGRAQIFVDGKPTADIDTYSTRPLTRQILFDTGVLSRGKHRVELRVTGTKSVLSTGTSVALDSVEIVS